MGISPEPATAWPQSGGNWARYAAQLRDPVDGQHFDSLLHATGLGSHAGPLTKIKTIGLVEAYMRVAKLLPGKIPISKGDLHPLADARNRVAPEVERVG